MKRIKVGFWGGLSDVLFSTKDGRFYFYEIESEEVHCKYGGQQYYVSRSGMSGAGFLLPKDENNDVILFGTYRVDIKGTEQAIKKVYSVNEEETNWNRGLETKKPIFGYTPIRAHKGFDFNFPIILTDGKKVCFVRVEDVKETLLCWEEKIGQKKELEWFDSFGKPHVLQWEFFNPSKFQKVNALRFIQLYEPREARKILEVEEDTSLFSKKIGIVKDKGKDRWFHSENGFFDVLWDQDPRNKTDEIAAGWRSEGDGFYWRRASNGVECFMEIERQKLSNGKYVVQEETPKWIDFEEFLEVLEFYSQDIQHFKDYFHRKVLAKARKDYIYASKRNKDTEKERESTLNTMKKNADIVLCVQDSLDTGNCIEGTKNFLSENNIHLDEDGYCKIGDILKNPNLAKMLKNFSFRKVIELKLLPED